MVEASLIARSGYCAAFSTHGEAGAEQTFSVGDWQVGIWGPWSTRAQSDRHVDLEFDDVFVRIRPDQIQIVRSTLCSPPIYYRLQGSSWIATTHVKGFDKYGMGLALDVDAMGEYLLTGQVTPPNTLLQNVACLLPFCTLTVSAGRSVDANCKLELPIPKEPPLSPAARALADMLAESLGAGQALLFSGGLDSLVLFELMRMNSDSGSHASYATSFWFENPDFEKDYAESAAIARNAQVQYFATNREVFASATVDGIAAVGWPLRYVQTCLLSCLLKEVSKEQLIVNGQGADALFTRVVAADEYEVDVCRADCVPWIERVVGAKLNVRMRRRRLLDLMRQALHGCSEMTACALATLFADTEPTRVAWQGVAESNGQKLVFPFMSISAFKLAFSLSDSSHGPEPKQLIRSLARTLGIQEEFVTRRKRSFGPVSRDWTGELRVLEDQARAVGLFDARDWLYASEASRRYVYWNMINCSLWYAQLPV
jgi:asparagine synthetase B (glutamine-hydrolysing)